MIRERTLSVGDVGAVVLLDELDVAEVQNARDDVQHVLLYVRRQTHHRHRMLYTTSQQQHTLSAITPGLYLSGRGGVRGVEPPCTQQLTPLDTV